MRVLTHTKQEETYAIHLLNKEELRLRLNLPSVRGVDELVRRRKIPVIRFGHRTVRFDWHHVQTAIQRLTVKEIGGNPINENRND